MTRPITPPSLQGPTAKEKKYDRQLRLWAANGQKALEEANVLLLNSGAGVVGVETLKNLILPGVGSFTIVDQAVVTDRDLGVNFFLTEESLGRSRAEESSKFLKELNPEVHVHAVRESIEVYVSQQDVLNQYNLILLVGPTNPVNILQKVSSFASKQSIPLFYIHSVGFYSHFSVQLPSQFPVVDTHPDPDSTQDLRLLRPWPELLEYMHTKTQNLHNLDDHDHGHVPYLLLLLYYLEDWHDSHSGQPPANYSEKKTFKETVQASARRDNAEGGEENYDEAVASVLKSLNPPSISSGLREVFEANSCQNLEPDSANFWVIAHAIQEFHLIHGVLPLPGALPDMKAKSAVYIELQNIYKAKARKDLAEVVDKVRSLETDLQKQFVADEQEIEAFCKGAAFVKLIKGRAIRDPSDTSAENWADKAKYMRQELQDADSLLPIYISLLLYDLSVERQDPTPEQAPETKSDPAPDFTTTMTELTTTFLTNLQHSAGAFDTEPCVAKIQSIIAELERAAGAELHSISALTGGMVAQEAIKVLTKQYIPVDNACVFDGIVSRAAVFHL